MEHYYKLTIRYNGGRYFGFQSQKDAPTIQRELEQAISRIAQSKDIRTLGSGRTDAGVHAVAQVVKVSMPLQLSIGPLKAGLNSLLPADIEIIKVESSNRDFHPIRDAIEKEYWYLFSSYGKKHPFANQFLGLFPFPLKIEKMREACKIFEGEYDFCNFYCTGGQVDSTVRVISRAHIAAAPPRDEIAGIIFPGQTYCFQVRGNGFLKQMVRLMMGALVEIGRGKCSTSDLKHFLEGPQNSKLGPTAPPQGLYLQRVYY